MGLSGAECPSVRPNSKGAEFRVPRELHLLHYWDNNMAEWSTYPDSVKIVLLCIAWYSFSSGNGVVGKLVLSDFPYPMTLSMVQLLSISLYLIPFLWVWNIPKATKLPVKYWFTMMLPLVLGKFFSSVSSHISIWKVPVSYAHTGKSILFKININYCVS